MRRSSKRGSPGRKGGCTGVIADKHGGREVSIPRLPARFNAEQMKYLIGPGQLWDHHITVAQKVHAGIQSRHR